MRAPHSGRCVISVDMGSVGGKWRPFARSRRAGGGGAALVVLGTLLSACGSGPSPQATASAYLAGWARQDWTAMRQLVANPPADFAAVNTAAFTGLRVRQASVSAGTLQTSGSTAKEPVTERLNVAGLGTITIRSELQLEQRSGKWLVNWSPAT